ncbi:MAG TPA: DUF1178 family protein [Dongiaceae bacterium]|jgi:hypothetical protein|nr:DUF1178 family protein [Dongiaceae bacterium]
MIKYDLRCQAGHIFDAWFRDSEVADRQLRSRRVECIHCSSRTVEKAIMAPRLGRHDGEPRHIVVSQEGETIKELLRTLREHIEGNCDYVGSEFAEEARRRHGQAEPRGIYGQASPKERNELHEEGIHTALIPWIPKNDA